MRNTENSPREQYIQDLFKQEPHELFLKARKASDELEKTRISLSSHEARLVSQLVSANKAKKFVEIGTLTGYSALWIAMGLVEGGEVFTFELEPKHAEKAQKIFSETSIVPQLKNKKINLLVGDAEEKLQEIESQGPFDGIFIDGNKGAYGAYLSWAEKNIRHGGIILADNIFLGGSVYGADGWASPKQTEVMQNVNKRLADTSRYLGSIIPTSEGLFAATKLF